MSFTPDVTVNLKTEDGLLTVYLARGGEQFPWADLNGRVIIGPPDGSVTSDGISMDSLEWKVDNHWVIEAVNQKGDAVELDSTQYAEALRKAETQRRTIPLSEVPFA